VRILKRPNLVLWLSTTNNSILSHSY